MLVSTSRSIALSIWHVMEIMGPKKILWLLKFFFCLDGALSGFHCILKIGLIFSPIMDFARSPQIL